MSAVWPLQDAKNRLSELVRASEFSPQVITVRGRDKAVVLSSEDFSKVRHMLEQKPQDFADFLLSIPRGGPDKEEVFERIKARGRKLDL